MKTRLNKPKAIAYGPEFTLEGSRRRLRWIENASAGLRVVGAADSIIRLRHTGWYLDPFGDGETARGYVLQLPARKGVSQYVPAILDANNPDCYVAEFADVTDDKEDAARFADMAASMLRRRVLLDSVTSSRGTVQFSRWVDRPGGVAQRADIASGQAYADSVLARGTPKRAPITRPFYRSELAMDPDTLSFYVAHLADTSFYSIGGCSDVEIVLWSASERLGQMGPGVVPVLVKRVADPNPFVRERVQEALMMATQDERVMARTHGEYLTFYDQPTRSGRDIVAEWWAKFGHFWLPADSVRGTTI